MRKVSDDKPKTARSYRGAILDDNAIVSINIKWLGQMLVLVAGLVYGYYRIETRIGDLEQGIGIANDEIAELVSKHIETEEQRLTQMEEELKWYQTELNLNPLSWRKKWQKREKK